MSGLDYSILPEGFCQPEPFPSDSFGGPGGLLSERAFEIAAEWAAVMDGAVYLVRTFDLGLPDPGQILAVMDRSNGYSLDMMANPGGSVQISTIADGLTIGEAKSALSVSLISAVVRQVYSDAEQHPLALIPTAGTA